MSQRACGSDWDPPHLAKTSLPPAYSVKSAITADKGKWDKGKLERRARGEEAHHKMPVKGSISRLREGAVDRGREDGKDKGKGGKR